jgi:hypothetical protein
MCVGSEIAEHAFWSAERRLRIDQPAQREQLADEAPKQSNYPPGAEYSYTNTGFSFLAILVGRVAGKSAGCQSPPGALSSNGDVFGLNAGLQHPVLLCLPQTQLVSLMNNLGFAR